MATTCKPSYILHVFFLFSVQHFQVLEKRPHGDKPLMFLEILQFWKFAFLNISIGSFDSAEKCSKMWPSIVFFMCLCAFKFTRTPGMLEHMYCTVINCLYRYGIYCSPPWPTLERVDAGSGGGVCMERHCRTQNWFQSRYLALFRLWENPSRQEPQLLTGYAVAHHSPLYELPHQTLSLLFLAQLDWLVRLLPIKYLEFTSEILRSVCN